MKQSNNLKNDTSRHDRSSALSILKKSVLMRAALVITVVILSIVLIFSLTVAWYTNVVQSGGLTFSAEKWDFNGEITVGDVSVNAYPGASDVVPMTITNNSDLLAAASVTVSKEQMDLEMKQRIYFYVDTNYTRNGEMMDRVYVSSNSSYTYTLFPNSEIIIDENIQNAAPLKWEWVYDVLGYYVVGQLSSTDSGSIVTVNEYIRPIIYDYDETKTTFLPGGALLTIDGTTTPQEYLAELSLSDGYEGLVDAATIEATGDGYYPVSVDENGYGVFAYFCSYTEIETNTTTDTSLGEEAVNCAAKISITGQNVNYAPLTVSSEAALLQMIDLADGRLIQLTNDIVLTETLAVESGSRVMLDLNENTLSSNSNTIISADEGSTVMLQNGSVVGTGASGSTAVYAAGANVSLCNVNVSNVVEGVVVRDNTTVAGQNSRIYVSSSTIVAKDDGLWIYGSGEEGRQVSVVVENSTIVGEGYAAITFNGTHWGTNTYISNSELTGMYTSIYHPQRNSTLNILESTLSGYTGLVVKGGTVNITDSTITGTGNEYNEPAQNDSGWTDTGDGVYLEGNYEYVTTINIYGDKTIIKKTSTDSDVLAVRNAHFDLGYSNIYITGGSYNTDVNEYCTEGYTTQNIDGSSYKVVEDTESGS